MKKTLRFAAVVSSLAAASALAAAPAAQALGSQCAARRRSRRGRQQRRDHGPRTRPACRPDRAPVAAAERTGAADRPVARAGAEPNGARAYPGAEGQDDGIRIDDATVQATLQRLAQANGMTLEQYRARLEAQGVPRSIFTSDARTELMLRASARSTARSPCRTPRSRTIASQRGPSASQQQDLRFQHIFIKAPTNAPQADIEAAQKKADALLQQAKSGADFEKLAKNIRKRTTRRRAATSASRRRARCRPTSSTPHRSCARAKPDADPRAGRLRDRAPRRSSPELRASAAAPKIVQTHVRHILLRVGEGKSEGAPATGRHPQLTEAGGDFAKFARTYCRTVRRRKAAISAGSARARPCRNSNAR